MTVTRGVRLPNSLDVINVYRPLVAAESTKRPSTQPCVLAGTLQPAKLKGRARFMADAVLEAAPES